MYQVHAPEVYITDWALADERARSRIERLSAGFGHPNPPVVSAAELAELIQTRGWNEAWGQRRGADRAPEPPEIVLSAFTLADNDLAARLAAYPQLRGYLLGGQAATTLRDGARQLEVQDCVCQTAIEVHCAYGCLHACDYCHVGRQFVIMTNLEALRDHLRRVMADNPWCRLWKFDNMTDTITLEPEYGASEVMVNFFAEQRDSYLLLYTKSDNVDHLLDLDHRGQTLISWSLAGEISARLIEKRTPPLPARLQAMRKCQEAGYRVRARFSPICPVREWRAEVTGLVEDLFRHADPEVITLDVLGWMNARQMLAAMDVTLFEPRFEDFVRKQALIEPGPHKKHLFPHEWRLEILRYALSEIRRVSPGTPVSICMETTAMWRELGPELGMEPGEYACCCGPTSVPGHAALSAE